MLPLGAEKILASAAIRAKRIASVFGGTAHLTGESFLRIHREIDAELRPRPGHALHLDVTIVLVHYQSCAR